MTAPSRKSVNDQRFLGLVEQANPTGTIMVITDNLSSHTSASTRTWLAGHPRIRHAFIPKRACWLNLQEGWWRLFRREALAGRPSPTRARSPWRPGWRPAGSTPAPARGCGAAQRRPHATAATPSSTGFSERSTNCDASLLRNNSPPHPGISAARGDYLCPSRGPGGWR